MTLTVYKINTRINNMAKISYTKVTF